MNGYPPTDCRTTGFYQPMVDIVILNTDMDMLLSSINYGTMGMHMTQMSPTTRTVLSF